jgi:hypothetical protein
VANFPHVAQAARHRPCRPAESAALMTDQLEVRLHGQPVGWIARG